ncbi:MAG: UDP-N-acetylglucosamine 2-epimerase (non-hydrolyzing) [bacterium]
MAPVVLELQRGAQFDHRLIVTGQHRTMLDQMLDIFKLKPDIDLDIMEPRQSLTTVTAKTIRRLERVFADERFDMALVHGDTSTSFAAALAAYYARIPVAHVEAGLRTGDPYNPFPEEMNRRLIDHLADLALAPTPRARDDLLRENIPPDKIFVTGNTVVDALLIAKDKARPDPTEHELPTGGDMLLVEAHRRENFGEPFRNICEALRDIVASHPGAFIVFPVHLNPNVREPAFEMLGGVERVFLLEPQSYLSFIHHMKNARLILTDSGGVQEEAPTLRTPVLVLRTKTERPEALDAKTALLVGTDREKIVGTVRELLEDETKYEEMARGLNPYGDGRAAGRIAEAILHRFGLRADRPADFTP